MLTLEVPVIAGRNGRMRAAPNREVEFAPGPNPQIGTSDWRATVNGTQAPPACHVDGCFRPVKATGLCSAHHSRKSRYGDPLGGSAPRRRFKSQLPADAPVDERFWERVAKTATCWEWSGAHKPGGYAVWCVDGQAGPAHRFAYELVVGPIPDDMTIDHLCRNTGCVNPEHMEVVTRAENSRRGQLAKPKETHCKRGHSFSEHGKLDRHGRQMCWTCRQESNRTYAMERTLKRRALAASIKAEGVTP